MRGFLRSAARAARLCFALVGTVIGAGFLSGAELVRFFPQRGFFALVCVSGLLYALAFLLLYRCGAKYGGFGGTLSALFGRAAGPVRALLLAASLVMCGSMLAGLNAAAEEGFGICASFPFAGLAGAALLFAFSGRGMKAVYAVNAALVPAVFAFLSAFCSLPPAPYTGESGSAFGGLVLCLSYVGMNAFLAAPVICDAGAADEAEKGSRAAGAAGCICAAALVCAGACIVLTAVAERGNASAQMPFLPAVGAGTAAGKLFSAVCVCGILTTLFSSFYPLQKAVSGKRRAALRRAALLAFAFALSLGGLRLLVRFVYPAVGAAGVAFLAVCAARSRLTIFSSEAPFPRALPARTSPRRARRG